MGRGAAASGKLLLTTEDSGILPTRQAERQGWGWHVDVTGSVGCKAGQWWEAEG